MELINWSLSTIDQIFATRSQGGREPSCPDGTFFAGYTMDSWKHWKLLCLAILSVEDVEDAFIIGFMIAGFLLIGVGGFLVYRQTRKSSTAVLALSELPNMAEGISAATNTQTLTLGEQNKLEKKSKLDAILEQNRRLAAVFEPIGKMEKTLEKLEAQLGGN